jgi:hypothetical protein
MHDTKPERENTEDCRIRLYQRGAYVIVDVEIGEELEFWPER